VIGTGERGPDSVSRAREMRRLIALSTLGVTMLIATVVLAVGLSTSVEQGNDPVRDQVEVDRPTVALATTPERTFQSASAAIWLGAAGAR
jgi:hypothetical protein